MKSWIWRNLSRSRGLFHLDNGCGADIAASYFIIYVLFYELTITRFWSYQYSFIISPRLIRRKKQPFSWPLHLKDIGATLYWFLWLTRGRDDGTVNQLKETLASIWRFSPWTSPGQSHPVSPWMIFRYDHWWRVSPNIEFDSSRYQSVDIIKQTSSDLNCDLKMLADIEDTINASIERSLRWSNCGDVTNPLSL